MSTSVVLHLKIRFKYIFLIRFHCTARHLDGEEEEEGEGDEDDEEVVHPSDPDHHPRLHQAGTRKVFCGIKVKLQKKRCVCLVWKSTVLHVPFRPLITSLTHLLWRANSHNEIPPTSKTGKSLFLFFFPKSKILLVVYSFFMSNRTAHACIRLQSFPMTSFGFPWQVWWQNFLVLTESH